jgi:hypothetical protein
LGRKTGQFEWRKMIGDFVQHQVVVTPRRILWTFKHEQTTWMYVHITAPVYYEPTRENEFVLRGPQEKQPRRFCFGTAILRASHWHLTSISLPFYPFGNSFGSSPLSAS